jgi:hypothetical protein
LVPKTIKNTIRKSMRKQSRKINGNHAQRVRKITPNRPNDVTKNMSENHAEIRWKIIQKNNDNNNNNNNINNSRFPRGGRKMDFQHQARAQSGTGEKMTHNINVVGKKKLSVHSQARLFIATPARVAKATSAFSVTWSARLWGRKAHFLRSFQEFSPAAPFKKLIPRERRRTTDDELFCVDTPRAATDDGRRRRRRRRRCYFVAMLALFCHRFPVAVLLSWCPKTPQNCSTIARKSTPNRVQNWSKSGFGAKLDFGPILV